MTTLVEHQPDAIRGILITDKSVLRKRKQLTFSEVNEYLDPPCLEEEAYCDALQERRHFRPLTKEEKQTVALVNQIRFAISQLDRMHKAKDFSSDAKEEELVPNTNL